MTSPILGEFLGTMMLVLLGNGVVAGVLLKLGTPVEGGAGADRLFFTWIKSAPCESCGSRTRA